MAISRVIARILPAVLTIPILLTGTAGSASANQSAPEPDRTKNCLVSYGELAARCIQFVGVPGDTIDPVERALAYTIENYGVERAEEWIDTLEGDRADSAARTLNELENSPQKLERAVSVNAEAAEGASLSALRGASGPFAGEDRGVISFGTCDDFSCWTIAQFDFETRLDGAFPPYLTLSGSIDSVNGSAFTVEMFDCVAKHQMGWLPDTVMYNFPNCKTSSIPKSWMTIEAADWVQEYQLNEFYYMEYALAIGLPNYGLIFNQTGWSPRGITWNYTGTSPYPLFY